MAPHPRRDFVVSRAHFRCEYCHTPEAWLNSRLHVDHIVARQHGGDDHDDNLCAVCLRCNSRKGTNIAAINPETGRVVRLFRPRQDRWSDHFSVVGNTIVGTSALGREMVRLLDLNAPPLLLMRAAMRKVGEVIAG